MSDWTPEKIAAALRERRGECEREPLAYIYATLAAAVLRARPNRQSVRVLDLIGRALRGEMADGDSTWLAAVAERATASDEEMDARREATVWPATPGD